MTRARRRGLIAIAVALLIGGRWWVTRPRSGIEPGLIGRWSVVESTSFPYAGEVELRGDGHAVWFDEPVTRKALWRAEGDELTFLFLSDGWKSRSIVQGLLLISDPFVKYGLHYTVRRVSPDQMVLSGPRESARADAAVTLQRVEESPP
jgi:hypothetical protein